MSPWNHAHHGKTPPCIDALIAAGVSRIVVAVGDPDARLMAAGWKWRGRPV